RGDHHHLALELLATVGLHPEQRIANLLNRLHHLVEVEGRVERLDLLEQRVGDALAGHHGDAGNVVDRLFRIELGALAADLVEDFPYRLSDNVRFADMDINQHVNNASYASYFETSRVMLMKDSANGLQPDGFGWVMVRLDINFRAELHWPGKIELGLGVAKIG